MKITKYGTVTISEEGVRITGFEFNAEGEALTLEDFAVAACWWAVDRVSNELDDVEVIVGEGNTWNGSPLIPTPKLNV